ncbi:MAG: LysR family transcriptional regulator [Oscillospiraceae bacterium]|nr:LysR family transcriptional regulator [Oscillospiraceae bacterium]
MDIVHLRYVVEVAKTGSITQAAANLGMNQPNLSKAIKTLEYEMGIAIFKRSSKGVLPTKEGRTFVASAQEILKKVEDLEGRYKTNEESRRSFGISVPRASYISYAFTKFVTEFSDAKGFQFDFCETSSMQAVRNVSSQKHNIGIIRFAAEQERYYHKLLRDLNLQSEVLMEFQYLAVMSEKNASAKKERLKAEDFYGMIELIHGDLAVPFFLTEEISRKPAMGSNAKIVYVYERGSQFDLLSLVPSTYMWVSPIPDEIRKRYHLVEKETDISNDIYKDILIQPKGYKMTGTEFQFLKHLYLERDFATR